MYTVNITINYCTCAETGCVKRGNVQIAVMCNKLETVSD